MDLGLKDRVAVITGASYGLGEAMAQCLVKEGARVVICARGEEQLARTAQALGPNALAVQADVSRTADIQTLFDTTVKQFGKLDIGVFGHIGHHA